MSLCFYQSSEASNETILRDKNETLSALQYCNSEQPSIITHLSFIKSTDEKTDLDKMLEKLNFESDFDDEREQDFSNMN